MGGPRGGYKRPRQWQAEWTCKLCGGSGCGAVCPVCSAPPLKATAGSLLMPVRSGSRTWEPPSDMDPDDLPISTQPHESEKKLQLHSRMDLDENERIEFKEAQYFVHSMASYGGIMEHPRDFFLPPSSPWTRQIRSGLPETKVFQRPTTTAKTYLTVAKEEERFMWQKYTWGTMIAKYAKSYPDGHVLARRVPPQFAAMLVECVVAQLNSRVSKSGELYLGIEDTDGRVMGCPLNHRQRRAVLYVAARVLQTIYPPVKKGDVGISFIPVYSDKAFQKPIPNHCVIQVSIHPVDPAPLYLHPKATSRGTVWKLSCPSAPVRRLGSVKRLSAQAMADLLAEDIDGEYGEGYAFLLRLAQWSERGTDKRKGRHAGGHP